MGSAVHPFTPSSNIARCHPHSQWPFTVSEDVSMAVISRTFPNWGKKMKWGVTPKIVHVRFGTAGSVSAAAMFHQLEHTQRLQGCNKLSIQETPCAQKSPDPLLTCLTLSRLNIGTELVGEGTSAMTGEGHQE